jgi:hypothetical protein
MGDHRVDSNHTVSTESHSGQNCGTQAKKAAFPYLDVSSVLKGLVHHQSRLRVESVRTIVDVDVLTQDAAVANRDASDCGEVEVWTDIHVPADRDARGVVDSGIAQDRCDHGVAPNMSAFADRNALWGRDAVREIDSDFGSAAYRTQRRSPETTK